MHAAGCIQRSADKDVEVEAFIMAIQNVFSKETVKAVLLIDAENTFFSINQKVLLYNIKYLWQLIYTIHFIFLPHQQGSLLLRGKILAKGKKP